MNKLSSSNLVIPICPIDLVSATLWSECLQQKHKKFDENTITHMNFQNYYIFQTGCALHTVLSNLIGFQIQTNAVTISAY